MRSTTTIRIDTETLKKAKELGLNVSKCCENALKLYTNALTDVNSQITNTPRSFLSEGSLPKESSWCGRRDLNPGRQRGRLMS